MSPLSLRKSSINPDFFAIRWTPLPTILDRPYTETWEALPLTKLASPINVRLTGDNIAQPIKLEFKGLSRKSVQARAVTLHIPEEALVVEGAATLTYGN